MLARVYSMTSGFAHAASVRFVVGHDGTKKGLEGHNCYKRYNDGCDEKYPNNKSLFEAICLRKGSAISLRGSRAVLVM